MNGMKGGAFILSIPAHIYCIIESPNQCGWLLDYFMRGVVQNGFVNSCLRECSQKGPTQKVMLREAAT